MISDLNGSLWSRQFLITRLECTSDPDTGRIFSQPPLISFKRDKNIGNFLVRSAFQTSNQAGTFKCARARCKTCPFICNVEKLYHQVSRESRLYEKRSECKKAYLIILPAGSRPLYASIREMIY